MKTDERREAERLRREYGMSVREVAVAVGVSRSTASLWLRDVPLTDDQKRALHARNPAYQTEQRGSRANADHGERQREVEDFWLAVVGAPRRCLHKSTVNVYSKVSARKRLNMLPYGTCRISVGSTEIVQTMYGSIQELAGFDRPDWLD